MSIKTSNPDADERLQTVLRDARPTASLPSNFQAQVWQRIAKAEAASGRPAGGRWLEQLVGWLLRPRFAVAVATFALLAGAVIGSLDGVAQAKQAAQARYVATVAMPFIP
ncbi:MAG TPA: hypothetical protein VFV96_14740 [Verrucomicrobiae bacterium]|nr:hypothetical protein [Verrucomicrobiae bacterium]